MTDDMIQRLARMVDCEVKDIPPELLKRCERVDELAGLGRYDSSLRSTQVLAVVVEQWEREAPCID